MDILAFAIDMERDGERFYTDQAAKNTENALAPVFLALAEDERKHAELLLSKRAGQPYTLAGTAAQHPQRNLFQTALDYQAKVPEKPEQAELYHMARDMEKKSIDLYRELWEKADDPETKELFGFLVAEETAHEALLEKLFRHVNRPNEWVESAEFGVREEY